jgi:hypothetical protein
MVTLVNGALNLDIQPNLVDLQGNDMYPMLSRVQKRSKNQTEIKWNADLGGAAATGEAVTALATTDSTGGSVVPATLPIGTHRFRHTFTVSTVALAQAQSAGEGAIANLLALTSRTGMRTILRSVATNIYTGTGTAGNAGIVGLGALHSAVTSAKSTTAYAAIDPANYANWSNYVNTAGSNRALTEALLFKMSEEIIGGGTLGVNSNYTAIYCSPAMATRYKTLFQASSQLQTFGNGPVDLGYSGLSFEGRPIYMDPYCPANELYFVDESEIFLHSFVEKSFAFGDEEPAEGLNFKIVELARNNPDAVQFAIVTKPQLQVQRRAAVAVLKAITQ